MNRHLRALLVVVGIAILTGVVALWALKGRESSSAEVGINRRPVELNQVLEDFEAKDLDGKEVRLSSFAGKIVVVNFWASWCGPCVEEMPSLIKLVSSFPQDVVLLAVSGDSTKEDIESFLKSFPELKTLPNVHVVWDENKSLSQKYEIYKLPESILVDRQRKVVKKISGIINWAAPDAFEYIKQLSNSERGNAPSSKDLPKDSSSAGTTNDSPSAVPTTDSSASSLEGK
jgi:cytochrome c biogenesis protein CcmG/thiol:disulfide interchange protein DsbE